MMKGTATLALRGISICILLCSLCTTQLHAQSGERCISWSDHDAQTSWPIRIATATDGSRCIAWGNGSQLFTPAGDLRGGISANTGSDGGAFALGNDRWAYLREKDTVWRDSEYAHRTVLRHFVVRNPWDAESVSDTIYHSYSFTNFEIIQFRDSYGEEPTRITFAQTPRGVLVATIFSTHRQQGMFPSSSLVPRWTFWPVDKDTYSYSGSASDVTFPFHSGNDLFLAAASPSGIPHLLERHRVENYGDMFVLRRLNDGTGVVDQTTVLDTIPAADDDRLSVFVPHDDGAVDILCLLPDTDTLTVRRYGSAGRLLDAKTICTKIHFLNGYPDVAHALLDNGHHLLTWSRVDAPNRTRLYIAAFDEQWNMIGVPRRVSQVETEFQIASGLDVRNDSILVAWLDSRSPYASVYIKGFPVSQFSIPRPPVYEVLFTHIEDNTPAGPLDQPQAREQYEKLRAALIIMGRRMHAWSIPWTLQPDWKFLLASLRYEPELISAETKDKSLLQYLRDDLDIVIDPHSHELQGYNYTDVAYLLDSLGVGGSTVIGGHVWDPTLPEFQQWDRYRLQVNGNTYPWAIWRGDIMMGSATPNHVNDPVVSGVWRPLGRWHFFIDDDMGNIVSVGQFTNDIHGVKNLVHLSRRGIIHPDSILTSSFHITPTMILNPVAQGAVEDTVLRVLASMRDAGDVVLTDFTSLERMWREYFNSEPHLFRPDVTTSMDDPISSPAECSLLPFYPNPASVESQISFQLPTAGHVHLSLHDVMGRCIRRIVNEDLTSGIHLRHMDVSTLPSGVYMARMTVKGSVQTARLVVRH